MYHHLPKIKSDTQLDGQSFWPLLIGNEYTPNEYVFAERTFHTHYDPMRSIRTDRFKYIRNFEAVWPDWFYSETSGGFQPHLQYRLLFPGPNGLNLNGIHLFPQQAGTDLGALLADTEISVQPVRLVAA